MSTGILLFYLHSLVVVVYCCAPIRTVPSFFPSLPVLNITTTTLAPTPLSDDYDDVFDDQMLAMSPPILSFDHSYSLRRDSPPIPLERNKKLEPSLFDLFRPLNFPTLPPLKNWFKPQVPVKNGLFADVNRLPSPFESHPTFVLKCSPPVSWTFCEPVCGTGDQAFDAETAVDNAASDIKEAISESFMKLHLGRPSDEQMTIHFLPNSTVLEDFGDYYDGLGYRYKTNGNSVAFKYHQNDTRRLMEYSVQVEASVRYGFSLSSNTIRHLANLMYQYLSLHKGTRFQKDIEVRNN